MLCNRLMDEPLEIEVKEFFLSLSRQHDGIVEVE